MKLGNILTRGGQTTIHGIRMFLEVGRILVLWSLIVGLICGVGYFKFHTTPPERAHLAKWVNANIRGTINPEGDISVTTKHGTYTMQLRAYINNRTIRQTMKPVVTTAWKSLKVFIDTTIISLILCIAWFVRRGGQLSKPRLIKGSYVVPAQKLIKHVKKRGKTSSLTLAGVPLYQGIERQHFLIHGSTGTGKSLIIAELLDGIRARGDRAIIYDKHGSFVERYYREEKDVLLNPLDARGQAWHPWVEARGAADFDMMAAGLMPHPPGQGSDPFWINAARIIFASTAFKMTNDKDKSLAKLLQYLFTDDLTELSTLLAGTEAASLVSDKAEKTALSVKSVLATYLKMLKYLKHDENPFSIREWVTAPKANNWLFISSRADKHESLKPLMSLWLDLAANALMSAGEGPTRRLWLIVDELPSLQRLPYLPAFMAEGRKFGGCFVGGIQNYFQLQKIYGPDGAKEVADLCNTRVFFRAPSHESAQWVSKELGDGELLETREGISYGANNVRDGVSINQQRIIRPAVSVSDIHQLPDLQGYLAMPPFGQEIKRKSQDEEMTWPIGKFKLNYHKRPSIAKGFIEVQTAESIEEEVQKTVVDNNQQEEVVSQPTSDSYEVIDMLDTAILDAPDVVHAVQHTPSVADDSTAMTGSLNAAVNQPEALDDLPNATNSEENETKPESADGMDVAAYRQASFTTVVAAEPQTTASIPERRAYW